MTTRAAIDVVIVNWNAGGYLKACVDALAGSTTSRVALGDVVVVDNASTDDSIAALEGTTLPLTIVRNEDNRGFGPACNQGAAVCHSPYILFLNPDAKVLPDTLDEVARFLCSAAADGVGVVGARMLDEAGLGTSSCSRFPTLLIVVWKMLGLSQRWPGIFAPQALAPETTSHSQEVDQIIGAFFLIRREVFEALDGFDPRFFMYYEEVDLSQRMHRMGWGSFYVHEACVIHGGRVSSDQVPAQRLLYSLRSRSQYAHKHWPRWQSAVLDILTVSLEGPARLVAAISRGRRDEVAHTTWALRRFVRYLRGHDVPARGRHDAAPVRES